MTPSFVKEVRTNWYTFIEISLDLEHQADTICYNYTLDKNIWIEKIYILYHLQSVTVIYKPTIMAKDGKWDGIHQECLA